MGMVDMEGGPFNNRRRIQLSIALKLIARNRESVRWDEVSTPFLFFHFFLHFVSHIDIDGLLPLLRGLLVLDFRFLERE